MQSQTVKICLAAVSLLTATPGETAPRLDPLFTDHAVVQRGQQIRIFGSADPNETLMIRLGQQSRSARADSGGRWIAEVAPPNSDGPLDLRVTGSGGATVRATDLLIGDVWLCSGQSNMELPVSRALNPDAETAASADPQLRLLTIEKKAELAPAGTFSKSPSWSIAGPQSVLPFAAACYFMGRDLRKAQHVPIGLINASWGGTAIRSWIDAKSAEQAAPDDAALLALFRSDPAAANRRFGETWQKWWLAKQSTRPWANSSALKWKPMKVGYWEQWGDPAMADFNGLVWVRSSVSLTPAEAAQAATLKLGVIDEIDETWINGVPVGNRFGWDVARNYTVAPAVLRAGINTIVVAILDSSGYGGFRGPSSELVLQLADGTTKPLSPSLQYSIASADMNGPPRSPWDAAAGLSLIYNGMIAPLGPLSLKGVAWYQGESDGGMPAGYDQRLSAMIRGWREQFRAPRLPFLIVGLPGWGAPHLSPSASGWAAVRDAQRRVGSSDGNAFVPAIDLGDRLELHPPQKQAVGARLAQAAQALARKEASIASGPQIDHAELKDADVVLTFRGVKGRLQSLSGAPIGFELCGADQASCRFARAETDGMVIRLIRDTAPVERVRYAWADAPVVNLYDYSGLPVSSFEISIGKSQ